MKALQPQSLPIYDVQERITEVCRRGGEALIIHAPTGSGKSTQVPQMLLSAGIEGEIVVLQPRRLAARMLATRVAWERGGQVGAEVGYQVRFDRMTSRSTRIRYVTEGVLLRQMMQNPSLTGVGAVVFDEFHERHLDGDVTLARCRECWRNQRPDLRLLVMSATLETAGLADYLTPCQVIHSEGRTFPVEVIYRPQGGRDTPIWEKVGLAARFAVQEKLEGDMLIFLPGSHEIRKTEEWLRGEKWTKDIDLCPLYGDLSPQKQNEAVAPSLRRKIVIATNIAETSLTIEGVRIVIDSGLTRSPNYDPRRGINTLMIQPISRASADQRAGRAGRTSPGICIRLWSDADHSRRSPHEVPEIHRLDLAETILTLMRSGVKDVAKFTWLEDPDPSSLERGLELLNGLGAIDSNRNELTAIGYRMADFPVPPRHARILVEAERHGGWTQACLMVALCQGRSLFARGTFGEKQRERFLESADTSDFAPLMRAWQTAENARYDLRSCQALGIHAGAAREIGSLVGLLDRLGDPDHRNAGEADISALALVGFPDLVAARQNPASKAFNVVGGRRGQIDRGSVIGSHTTLVVAAEMAEIEGREVNVILGNVTAISEDLLRSELPNLFRDEEAAIYDPVGRRVVAERRTLFRDLVLRRQQSGIPSDEQAAQILADRVVSGELTIKSWNVQVEAWLARVEILRKHMPQLELPAFTEEDRRLIVHEICLGAHTYRQIKDRPVWPALDQWLSREQKAAVEFYAPERVTLSNGLSVKVDYLSSEPAISVILQKLYDVEDTPTIADGKLTLGINILAPNQRPAQITRDLRGFWINSYPSVKAQLQGRYPKHEWR